MMKVESRIAWRGEQVSTWIAHDCKASTTMRAQVTCTDGTFQVILEFADVLSQGHEICAYNIVSTISHTENYRSCRISRYKKGQHLASSTEDYTLVHRPGQLLC